MSAPTERSVAEEVLGEGFIELGEFVRRARRMRGWSMRDLARASSLDVDTVANVEKARHYPKRTTLDRIALAFASAPAEPDSVLPAVVSEESTELEDGDRLVQRVTVTETFVRRSSGAGS